MVKSDRIQESPVQALDAVCELIESSKVECTILRCSAGACSDAQLNELLIEMSNERGCFAFELEGCVERYGVIPTAKPSPRSPIYRAIRNLRALMKKGDTPGLLKECEHHEEHMIKEYGKVLRQSAPADVWAVLKRQYDRVRQSRRRLRNLLANTQSGPLPC
jgi:uncharacterized protein (TIGR02284 family)